MLHFLTLKEEMQNDADLNQNASFPRFLPEEEIQKVIFDNNYLKFMKKRMEEDYQE